MLLTFVVITAYMIMGIKVPTLMVNAGYGDATDASYVILGLSLGAMLGGLIFGRVLTALKNDTLPVSMLVLAVAMALIAVSDQTWVTIVAGFITGIGVRQFFPWVLNIINQGDGSASGTAMILIAYNLAGSLSPYSALAIQSVVGFKDLHVIFWINAGIYITLAVVTAVVVALLKRKPR